MRKVLIVGMLVPLAACSSGSSRPAAVGSATLPSAPGPDTLRSLQSQLATSFPSPTAAEPTVAAKYADACEAWHNFEDFEKMQPPAVQLDAAQIELFGLAALSAGGALGQDFPAFFTASSQHMEWVLKGELIPRSRPSTRTVPGTSGFITV